MTSENILNIKHHEASFWERLFSFSSFYAIIVIVFSFLIFLKSESINFVTYISVIIGYLGLSFILNLRNTSIYLLDFYSDTKLVRISYSNYNKRKELITTIDKITVKLNNRTSFRSGFKCELEIHVADLKFKVNDEFDWSLNEIKCLFEYIQNSKSINLTEADLFILERIKIAINNSET